MSYASTGTSLSDKTRYDYFARTVPPDTFQALALVDLVTSFNWSYVSIVSSEGQYGDSGMKAFIHEARARNICIAVNEKVPNSANDLQFDLIFANLQTKPNAKAVVLFVRMEDARGILKAAKRARNINFFTWVASDGWGKEEKLVEGKSFHPIRSTFVSLCLCRRGRSCRGSNHCGTADKDHFRV